MKNIRVEMVALAGLLLSVAVPAELTAQRVRVGGRATVRVGPIMAEVRFPTERRRVEYRNRRVRFETHSRTSRPNSDAMRWCLSELGRGHPDYGWAWCVDRDYVHPVANAEYVLADYDGFSFRHLDRIERNSTVESRDLRRLLRGRRFDRVRDHAREVGRRGDLWGEWFYPANGGRALIVHSGNVAIAEFHDRDFDGRVEVTFWLWP